MPARRSRFFLAALALIAAAGAALAISGRGHTYHGPRTEPATWNPRTDRAKIVAEARKLEGLWYDPVQGYFNDIGGKMGLIVCMDVPRLAYRNAGTSLRKLLETDYRAHPEHYGTHDGRPGDPYFDRRARNLYSYCKFNGCLDMNGPPRPGDVVFMSHGPNAWISHIALVSAVDPAGRYRVVEASRDEWYVTREEPGEKMLGRGWTFRGFGRPLK
ncbi:MAG: DUF1287 domain-containing protein [Elusimicrobia bacterium]|nr:DUF1287 domain-containing protein [Elusimicrobiota bacterium]